MPLPETSAKVFFLSVLLRLPLILLQQWSQILFFTAFRVLWICAMAIWYLVPSPGSSCPSGPSVLNELSSKAMNRLSTLKQCKLETLLLTEKTIRRPSNPLSLTTTMKLFIIMLEYCYSMIWLLLEGVAGEKKGGMWEFGYNKYIFTCFDVHSVWGGRCRKTTSKD